MNAKPSQQNDFSRDDWRTPYSPLNKVGRFQRDCLMRVLSEALVRLNVRLGEVEKILDLGCGQGAWLNTFADIRGSARGLSGIDLSEPRLEVARSLNPGINFLSGDIRHLPFDDNSHDMVTTFASLMFLPDDGDMKSTIEEIGRVLKPGGYALLFEPVNQGNTPETRGLNQNTMHEFITTSCLEAEFSIPFFRRLFTVSTASLIRRTPELFCRLMEELKFLPGANRLYVLKARKDSR